jgi:uncharacterized protein (TIGR00269 family)
MSVLSKVERSVSDTIKKYALFSKKDKVFVAVSGGKDSTVVLYVLHKLGYNVEGITVDALIGNYTKENLENLRSVCSKYKIKLHEINFRDEFGYSLCYLRSVINSKGHNMNSCAVCGVLRRYLLNKHARLLNAKVLVTGHNLDDEAQSVLMNLFRNTFELSARLGPYAGMIESFSFIPRVKPLYFVFEKDIIAYSKAMKFPVNYSHCPCRTGSFRNEISIVLDDLEKNDPIVKLNIIKNFIKILPKLKEYYKTTNQLNSCKQCGEPCKEDICQACRIVGLLGRNSFK